MLSVLRKTAPAVAALICMALLAMWLTGAHGHRHVGEHSQAHALDAANAAHADFAHAHDGAAHDESLPSLDRSQPHPLSVAHDDGHADVELQALQPPFIKHLSDAPVLALLLVVLFALASPRRLRLPPIADPPTPRSPVLSLRPPSRGPPLPSVA